MLSRPPTSSKRVLLGLLGGVLLISMGIGCEEDPADDSSQADAGSDPRDSSLEQGEDAPLPDIELAQLVNADRLRDRSTLNIVIEHERTGRVPGDFEDPVWQIGLRFRSQSFLGTDWIHSGFLVLPEGLEQTDGAAAIVEFGTSDTVTGVSDATSFLLQYGAITSDRLDLPLLLLDDVPPPIELDEPSLLTYQTDFPQCFGGTIRSEAQFEECLRNLSRASDRLDLYPALPVAVTYIRAITLLQELSQLLPTEDLPFEVPPFQVDRVAVLADGLDGYALRYAMALDERLAGVMVATDIGRWRDFHELQRSHWLTDYAFGDPAAELAFLDSPQGAEFTNTYGLETIANVIRDRSYLVSVGTNASDYPLQTLDTYRDDLPDDHALLYVANYADGFGSGDHLLAWRVFLAHLFQDRQYSEVRSSHVNQGGNIIATVTIEGTPLVGSAELWYVQRHSQNDDEDFRDAIWRSVAVEYEESTLVARFTPLTSHSAYFVRIIEFESIYEGPITSPIYPVSP